MDKSLLLQVLRQPACVKEIDLAVWDSLLPQARHEGVLGILHHRFKEHNLLDHVPKPVYPHLQAAASVAAEHQRMVRWEISRIRRALLNITTPVILLKGAAYVMLDLSCAYGRLVADVDILVSKKQLSRVEEALRAHHWETVAIDDYDQKYYRQWMHELPPLRHRLRGTIVDVHHTILPITNRLSPDPQLLFDSVQPIHQVSDTNPENETTDGLLVLSPVDMVLHSTVHAFYDGDLSQCLRNLLDLDMLLSYFSERSPIFWQELPQRAHQLRLQRPLYYALRYCQYFMHTPIPASIIEALTPSAPSKPLIKLMDNLVAKVLLSDQADIAQTLLYVRSHWLRMPPLMLTGHLWHKAHKRLQRHLMTKQ